MEDLSRLLLEERAHSEQFKANFIQLKTEYDKLLIENQRLNEEIAKKPKIEHPDDILKQKWKNLQVECRKKEYVIHSLQEKVKSMDEALREKLRQEDFYASKFAATEVALEHTKSLLSRLQFDASTLASNLEEKCIKEEHNHKKEIAELAEKFAKSERDKKLIAHQVLKATTKAQSKVELLRDENNQLMYTITKLKESLERGNWEKSELSSQLEVLKVQHSQERGELFMQVRNHEGELTKLQAKIETLENKLQEAVRDKEVNFLSTQAAEKEVIKLRADLYELEIKHKKAVDQAKRDLDAKDHTCKLEVDELNKVIHAMKMDREQEHAEIKRQSDKLLQHEKQLTAAQEQLRKKELEVATKVQDVKIQTENKYRAVLEEKFHNEIEVARRSAEVESQLILERNLRTSLEAELRKLMTEIQALNDRLQATEGFPAERKRLEVAVELKEMEKNQLAERYQELVKEKELASTRHSAMEVKLSHELATLQDQVRELQQRLTSAEAEASVKIRQLQDILKTTKQKSHQYAKLIWKLRQRLAGHNLSQAAKQDAVDSLYTPGIK